MASKKTYALGMFPYPSGEGLHVGHVRIYTAVDVMARYFRMKNRTEDGRPQGSPLQDDVLSPMGWDAFGLPAENAAIKNKANPQDIVPRNYSNFRRQMQDLSFSFDWDRELATTDPTYYGLTQWIFLELYKKGLVYREEVPINWCPKCKTGLANEEVLPDGTHERCGTPTGKKNLPQWVMKITAYAERLLDDLDGNTGDREGRPYRMDKLDWPRGILEMQRNWIGKKEGVLIHHKVKDMDLQLDAFSAYPAWLFADTFMVIAPEHPMVNKLVAGTKYENDVKKFVQECAEITDTQKLEDKFEKKGAFTGRYAQDPFNNDREMPVWVANFAMMGFGTGIIRCSAHDPRDYEFAQKYEIELKEVVERTDPNLPVHAHTNEGVLKASGPFTGKSISKELIAEIVEWIVREGMGKREVTWHLRDWVFSRQRYWGEPIPLIFCAKCGVVPLPEKELPLTLPYLESYEPTDTGESPLSRVSEWVNTTCPNCGGPAKRETDTMPNWAGSCWYHLAFAFWRNSENTDNQKTRKTGLSEKSDNQKSTKQVLEEYKVKSEMPFSDFWKEYARPAIDKWLPVDWYLGGAEHAVLHLLYARFWMKVLYDLGHIGFSEPYLRLRSVGMVLAEDGRKMSKSWGNVINPDDMVKQFGSDAVRLYEMFMGPWDQAIAWDTRSLIGLKRFIERLSEAVVRDYGRKDQVIRGSIRLPNQLQHLIKKVGEDIVEQKFNTAIAETMKLVNSWNQAKDVGKAMSDPEIEQFLTIITPFMPKTAQKLWEKIGAKGRVDAQPWPDYDPALAKQVTLVLAVQVNGKLRATIEFEKAEAMMDERAVLATVFGDARVKKWVTDKPKKIIFVPGRLVNLLK